MSRAAILIFVALVVGLVPDAAGNSPNLRLTQSKPSGKSALRFTAKPVRCDDLVGAGHGHLRAGMGLTAHNAFWLRSRAVPFTARATLRHGVVAVAAPARLAPLVEHVARVVAPGSDEQVIHANASRVVAPMTDAEAVLDRSVRRNPHEPMCKGHPSTVIRSAAHEEAPIAHAVQRPSPKPATGNIDGHLGPEASRKDRVTVLHQSIVAGQCDDE